MASGLNMETKCNALCFATEDRKEGMDAFLEKQRKRYLRINNTTVSFLKERSRLENPCTPRTKADSDRWTIQNDRYEQKVYKEVGYRGN